MQIKNLREGKYFYTIEKIWDSTRQPIFKIILVAVLLCVTILVGITGLEASKNGDEIAGIQEILSSIIGAMVTIIVTTYSIKLLLVQLTSQQFSPRVIRILLKSNARNLFLACLLARLCVAICSKLAY